jgi:phospholipid transport system substrate-binding protein
MVLAGALVVGMSSAPASAGVPTDQLKGAVERVLKTLEDPTLKGEARLPERRVAVRKIANEIFDFSEIAKRSMARHWQPLSEAQRTEFVGLFADLLERSYISKIETYGGEKIQYTAERADGDLATVSTRIITKNGTEVPVDYRMIKRADRWLVYDVSIEGVSLVSNYRTQFNKIIQTTSYNELVSKLRNKQDELLAEDKKKKP